MHQIQQNAMDAILIHDLSGRILSANLASCELLGYSREELLRLSAKEIKAMESQPTDQNKNLHQQEHNIFQSKLIARDGTIVPVEAYSQCVTHAGEPCVLTIAYSDAFRKKLEKQLIQTQKMEAMGKLASGLTHEFNNLITAVISYSNFLLQSLDADTQPYKDAHKILRAGKQAANLVTQLMTFGRKKLFNFEVVDLNIIIRQMETLIKHLIGEDIELNIKLEPQLYSAKLDATQMELMLINLTLNARDAMPNGGKLTICTENTEIEDADKVNRRYLMLTVSDTGIGMDEDTKSRIFDPFFTTKKEGKGTGLGLATIKSTIEEAGGFIQVASQPQCSTTFRIYLPSREATSGSVAKEDIMPEINGCETILVVEDDDRIRDLVRTILQRNGYHVLEAHNGEQAIGMVKTYQGMIHMLLTDVVMPGKCGLQLVQDLKTHRPKIKVLYMSGYPTEDIANRELIPPGAVLVSKPFTPQILLAKVKSILNSAEG